MNAAAPNGQWFGTVLADSLGGLILSPGVDQVLLPTDFDIVAAATSASPESTDVTRPTSRQVAVDALVQDYPQQSAETTSHIVGSEDVAPDAIVKNISIGGRNTHIFSPGVVAEGSLGLPTNMAAAGSQTFQIGNLPVLNTLLYWNSPARMMTEQVFQALARNADTRNDCVPEDRPVSGLLWDVVPGLDWLESSSQTQAVGSEPEPMAKKPAHQAANQQDVSNVAVADQAELADL